MSDIKDMFVSRWRDGYILNLDFSQLEIIVLAILSGDEQLLDDIKSGKDMHRVRAAELFGIPESKVTKTQRRIAKALSFQLQYGAGAPSMAAKNGVSKELAQRFIDNYYARYPQIKEYQKNTAILVEGARVTSGEHTPAGYPRGKSTVASPTGRRYTFLEYDAPDWARSKEPRFSPTEMKNYFTQGTATGDFVALFRGQVYRAFTSNWSYWQGRAVPINTVHDSVMFDCDTLTTAKELGIMLVRIAEQLPETIEQVWGIPIPLPLPVDLEVGKDWGHLEKLNIEEIK